MDCPHCAFDNAAVATECARCGIVFAKWSGEPAPRRMPLRPSAATPAVAADRRIGREQLLILGSGLAAAIVIYLIPFTRFVMSALVTLFHEFGHAVVGWLLGMPSLPAFDFVYGGGWTHTGAFHLSIALAIAGGFAWLGWTFREQRPMVVLVAALFLVWLLFVSSEWRRELAFSAAGHAAEFILAGILFYQALAGVGWRIPEVERPLGAFAAFFVQIHSMAFAWKLTHDADFLAWYREGKGGAAMNDLEVVALDLHIYTKLNPGIEGVAHALLLFSFVPIAVALVYYLAFLPTRSAGPAFESDQVA